MTPKNYSKERAEAVFKARALQEADKPAAVAEYHAAQDAVLQRTRRLRALRLARDSAVTHAPPAH